MNRRAFFRHTVQGAGSIAVASMIAPVQALRAQGQSVAGGVEMSPSSYIPVRLPRKPNAQPQLDDKGIETLERKLACPCPCTLDVFTCRTTDFSCGISPAVHRDVIALVEGGYSADEIMDAMLETYGDFILTSPRKQGFNLVAWFAPFAAVGVGAVAIAALLRGWRRNADAAQQQVERVVHVSPTHADDHVDATPEELARLEAAVRNDG